jgi:hypothetical protein
VSFAAVRNKRNRIFLASTKNFVDANQIKKFLVDGGTSSILIPFANLQELACICIKYGDPLLYAWSISESKGVGGISQVLLINKRNRLEPFVIKLCIDGLP